MKKKTLVLALSALVAGSAFAQSNVQLYGVVDYGYAYRHDLLASAKNAGHAKSQSTLDQGMDWSNRLGFKGEEYLGNDLKAVFVLERGFALDTGEDYDGFNCQAYMGLAGKWGTLAGGHIYTPYYDFLSFIDPFGDGTVGRFSNVKGDVLGKQGGLLFSPYRMKNAITYISPTWSGFNFTLAYSNNAFDPDGVKEDANGNVVSYTNGGDNNMATLAATLKGDAYLLVLTYHRINLGSLGYDTITAGKAVDNFSLGGTYDFGAVKLAASWSWDKLRFKDSQPAIDQNNFLLGATVPFGAHALRASFNYSLGDDKYGDAWLLAVGYTYNLSKRTRFYATYAWIDNDEQQTNAAGVVTKYGRSAVVSDTSAWGGVYQQAFQLGITHSF